ncbi:right-handed parallel beta-helix repeat-containing protein [Pseudorhodobacter sp.]|uniref:right-handed parallel beta-helix repeat-containing protein n=1 Tax=Pseudorhodobacter sp. TaxID=1934400 RepID=UPI002AFE5C21|nr:right-handed parallel beta-helix repeat-containing protein [Pseudorhodobacter sp.]
MTYDNFTVIDCASVVNFTRSNGSDAQMPKDCHVRNLRVIGQLVSALPIAILIDGNGCSVELTAEGAFNANKRVLINRGAGNKVTIKGDPVLQVPWVNVSANATDSEVVLDVGALTTQPTVSSDNHLVEVNGPRTKVKARLNGVQNVGYIRINSGGPNSEVKDCNIVAPASLAASAMVRMSTDDCHITDNTFRDEAGLMHAIRMITGCDRNFVTNNVIRRAAGAAVQIDSGASGNIVVNNSLNGATITNSGTGSTVSPNY